jgi:hypothetical protein
VSTPRSNSGNASARSASSDFSNAAVTSAKVDDSSATRSITVVAAPSTVVPWAPAATSSTSSPGSQVSRHISRNVP